MTTHVDCPICEEDEIDFRIGINGIGDMKILDEFQHCSCGLSDKQWDEARNTALDSLTP